VYANTLVFLASSGNYKAQIELTVQDPRLSLTTFPEVPRGWAEKWRRPWPVANSGHPAAKVAGAPMESCRFVSIDARAKPSLFVIPSAERVEGCHQVQCQAQCDNDPYCRYWQVWTPTPLFLYFSQGWS